MMALSEAVVVVVVVLVLVLVVLLLVAAVVVVVVLLLVEWTQRRPLLVLGLSLVDWLDARLPLDRHFGAGSNISGKNRRTPALRAGGGPSTAVVITPQELMGASCQGLQGVLGV